jgi:hypothetical protein
MSERRPRSSGHSASSEMRNPCIPRDLSESHHHLQSRKRRDLAIEVLRTGRNLVRQWFVVRWRAAHRRCDVNVTQLKAIVSAMRCGDVGEAGAMQRGHQKISGPADSVAGEHTARPIGAVCRRRQAEDEHTRAGIAEARHWPSPVELVAICRALFTRNARTVGAQARASLAVNDGIPNGDESGLQAGLQY